MYLNLSALIWQTWSLLYVCLSICLSVPFIFPHCSIDPWIICFIFVWHTKIWQKHNKETFFSDHLHTQAAHVIFSSEVPVDNRHQKPRSLSCLSFKPRGKHAHLIIEAILTILLWWWRGHVLGTCNVKPAELQQVMIRPIKRKCSVLLHCHITPDQSDNTDTKITSCKEISLLLSGN